MHRPSQFPPGAPDTDRPLAERALWLVRVWYWLAPGFLALWLGFGVDVRYPFLDVLPGARWALYGTQLGCGALIAFRPRLTATIGTLESSLSIALLIITTWMAYWGISVDATGAVGNPFTPDNVASLTASAVVLAISWIGRGVSPR